VYERVVKDVRQQRDIVVLAKVCFEPLPARKVTRSATPAARRMFLRSAQTAPSNRSDLRVRMLVREW